MTLKLSILYKDYIHIILLIILFTHYYFIHITIVLLKPFAVAVALVIMTVIVIFTGKRCSSIERWSWYFNRLHFKRKCVAIKQKTTLICNEHSYICNKMDKSKCIDFFVLF